jgi:23S rRNA pseudouridine1911/1915/1917 synthase
MKKLLTFIPEIQDAGKRIDVFITGRLHGEISRSRIQSLIDEGFVKINDAKVKASARIKIPSTIVIEIPEVRESCIVPQDIPIQIIYEDLEIIIINKPPGMVVHPAHGNPDRTLVNAIMFRFPDIEGISGESRPGIVHRLDKETSGVMVVCRNDRSHRSIEEQFKNRSIDKDYIAIVLSSGKSLPDRGEISTLIARSRTHRKKFSSKVKSGRESVTEFEVLDRSELATLVRVHPLTGRTHQIRVHFSEQGFPVLGDKIYGRCYPSCNALPQEETGILRTIKRQALHAYRLALFHPVTNSRMVFTAKIPEDMDLIIKTLFKRAIFSI